MRKKRSRLLRTWMRDTFVGAAIFLVLPLLASLAHQTSTAGFDDAVAAEVIATRAVEATSPSGATAENAIVAVAELRPDAMPLQVYRTRELAVLALTLSLLMGLNLAFWRHLRRVSAPARRKVWRKRA
jgi:hypothetical protein